MKTFLHKLILCLILASGIGLSTAEAQKYCYPKIALGCEHMYFADFSISKFSITSTCNPSNGGIDTSNVKTSVIDLYRGQAYYMRAKSDTVANMAIFFDINHDGDFDDPGETIGTENNFSTTPTTIVDTLLATLIPPKNMNTGTTRLRIIASKTAVPVGSACTNLTSYGQIYDFLVNITAYKTDAYVVGFIAPKPYECSNASQPVKVVVRNFGLNDITSIPLTLKFTNTSGTTTTLTQTFSKTMKPDQTDTFTFTSTVNTGTPGAYKFKVYSAVTGDLDHTNDTLNLNVNTSVTVKTPVIIDANLCGYNKATFSAITGTTGAKTFWYKDLNTNTAFYTGDYFTTPNILTRDTTYYVESTFIINKSLQTQYLALRANAGEFIDITAKTKVTIDSFDIDLMYTGAKQAMRVYYREGSYKGYESDSSTWKSLGIAYVLSVNSGQATRLSLGGFTIPAGKTYGVYIATDDLSRNIYYNGGNTLVSNSDIIIEGATTAGVNPTSPRLFPLAAEITTGRTWDGEVYYHPEACHTGREPVTARVRAGIPGMRYIQSKPFNGFFNNGNLQSPDAMCPQDTVVYELTGPTNYGNAGFKSKWDITSISVKTIGGNDVNDTMITMPTSSSNFSIRLNPNKSLADSIIIVSVTTKSLVDSCENINTRYIQIGNVPKANFVFRPVCEGLETTFDDSTFTPPGTTLARIWDFGDGESATTAYPSHTYKKSGVYDVTYKVVTAAGCFDAIIKKVSVYAKPKTNFGMSTACVGQTDTFFDNTVTSGFVTKQYWHFGTTGFRNTSTAPKPVFTYTKPGKYTVTYAVEVSTGCIDTLYKEITIVEPPKASFTSKAACLGNFTKFTNNSTGGAGDTLSYFWDFGNGSTSTDKNPSEIYYVSSAYTVTLTVKSKYGCDATTTGVVAPSASPKAKIGLVSGCVGNLIQLYDSSEYASSGYLNRKWYFNTDTSTFKSAIVNKTFSKAGTYKATLVIYNASGCMDSVERTFVINEAPKAIFKSDVVCVGKPMTFNNSSTFSGTDASYSWNFGDVVNNTSTDKNPTHVYAKEGTYTVSLTVKAGACTNVVTQKVTVNPGPTIDFSMSNIGKRVEFTPSVKTYNSYLWYFGENNDSSTAVSPTYFYSTLNGTFHITLKVTDANGCTSITEKELVLSGIKNANQNNYGVNIYPNPFSHSAHLEYTLDKKSVTQIMLQDVNGKTALVIKTSGMEQAGAHKLTFDASGLSSGIYILRVIVGDNVYNQQIEKLK